ncbi:hypothetical protein [Candidatus Nitrotoga sp. 1052]|uniref:hypothetical protein n=1 Tax=Candidatus Nitrotoga sp. 1052 TaxID=2886964 RepID=UPI001EF64DE9|nr:hypothetical protein [Candidatus Nitrotoga sp. 1052]
MQKRLRNSSRTLACLLLGAVSLSTQAVDFSLSGYGTIGYAISDQNYTYQRYINNKGSFERDTIFGAQLNAQFNPEWSATLQVNVAPPALLSDNQNWQPTFTWAFLSYRPTNDWLFRVGKLRIPFYLNSENANIGKTYVSARLPVEVYASASTVDFIGASFAKTWQLNENEFILDGYWGNAVNESWRFYARDPGNVLTKSGAAGEFFAPLAIESKGLRLSLNRGGNTFLAGMHFADTTARNGTTLGPSTYVPAPAGGCAPIGIPPAFIGDYYCPAADGPSKIQTVTTNLGASIDLGHGFRTIGEYVRRKNEGSTLSPDSKGFYLSLQKEIGDWTPYLTYAKLTTKNRDLYQAVNGVQTIIPAVNAFERNLADAMVVYNQNTWALGTSCSLGINSKIKAEWSVVQTGIASSFIDAPPGGKSGDQRINVFSLSYNFTF